MPIFIIAFVCVNDFRLIFSLGSRYHGSWLVNWLLASSMEIPRLEGESGSMLRSLIDEARRIVLALVKLQLSMEQLGCVVGFGAF